jgi:hypothetical protein
MPGYIRKLKNADRYQERCCRQRCADNERQERIQKEEPVILQEHEQSEGKTCVVESKLLRPLLARVFGAEMNEGNSEQKKSHRASQPRAGR